MCKISFGWGRHVVSEKTLKPMWEGRGTAHPNSIGHGAARSYASVSTAVIAAAVWYEPGHQSSRALVAPSFPHSAYIYIYMYMCVLVLSLALSPYMCIPPSPSPSPSSRFIYAYTHDPPAHQSAHAPASSEPELTVRRLGRARPMPEWALPPPRSWTTPIGKALASSREVWDTHELPTFVVTLFVSVTLFVTFDFVCK
jgi:hypothetical protein